MSRRSSASASRTLVRCTLETGRTHQIRVHLTAIGHPLVGDPTYGARRSAAGIPPFGRQALHAHRLGYTHPVTRRAHVVRGAAAGRLRGAGRRAPRDAAMNASSASREALRARLDAAGLDWIVPAWAAPAHVVALSTTKAGGVAGAFDPGPSRASEAASPRHVMADRARLASFLPAAPLYLHQVHGTAVVEIDAATRDRARTDPPQADAAMDAHAGHHARGARGGLPAGPVRGSRRQRRRRGARRLARPRGGRAGSDARRDAASRRTRSSPGSVRRSGRAPSRWAATCSRPASQREASDEACFAPHAAGKWLADLPGLARRRLARAGVRDVAGGTWCTVREAARFHSWRRERSAGRMATAIAIGPRQAE